MKKSRPTIREVALAAGVSLGTASRALNRTGNVSESAIKKVHEAAAELGYEPDSIAQMMRGQNNNVVGMLVSDFTNPFIGKVIQGTEGRLQKAGYALLIANTGNDHRKEKSLVKFFRQRRIGGLILGPCEKEDADFVEHINKNYFPVITYDRDIGPSCSGLYIDHLNGAFHACRYLLNLGHKRIALISSAAALRPTRERIKGFKKAFAEKGLKSDPQLILAEHSSMEFVYSETLSLLSSDDPPTAFICLGTRILAGALQALRHSGRSIPEDVSIIGVGDSDLARLHLPAVTAVNWDLESVGEVLAELLLKKLSGEAEVLKAERIKINTELSLRQSCGPLIH